MAWSGIIIIANIVIVFAEKFQFLNPINPRFICINNKIWKICKRTRKNIELYDFTCYFYHATWLKLQHLMQIFRKILILPIKYHDCCVICILVLCLLSKPGYGQKPLRTEVPGSKSDKVNKNPWMNLTTRTKILDKFYN